MTDQLRKAAQDVLDAQAVKLQLQNTTGASLYVNENLDKAIEALRAALAETPEDMPPTCNPHPDAPHGFNRNASHSEDRYVCECEGWEPETPSVDALIAEIDGLNMDFALDATWTIRVKEIYAILDKYRARGGA